MPEIIIRYCREVWKKYRKVVMVTHCEMDKRLKQIIYSGHIPRYASYRISPYLKFGLWDYTCFKIGITGLQDPPKGP